MSLTFIRFKDGQDTDKQSLCNFKDLFLFLRIFLKMIFQTVYKPGVGVILDAIFMIIA